jgi:hypothetical protein
MKIIIGFLLALVLCSVAIPTQAASFGLSPAMVDYQITKGSSKTMEFTVVGYSGTVDISVENMPVSVSPASISAVAGSKITVTIKCNDDAVDGLYEGKIVFLAKNGNSVMSGIKVRCNLTVGNSSSPVTYGGGSGGSSSGSSSGVSVLPGVLVNAPSVVSSSTSVSGSLTDDKEKGSSSSVLSEEKYNFNWLLFVEIIVAGLLFFGLFVVGYKWMQHRRKI